MVDVDVDVEDARMNFEQLQYGDVDVVDVAEAGRLELFGMMQSTRPVDGNVALLFVGLFLEKHKIHKKKYFFFRTRRKNWEHNYYIIVEHGSGS